MSKNSSGPTNKLVNRKILFEGLLATILVFCAMWLLFFLFTWSIKPLNYFAKAVKEVKLNDLYFSEFSSASLDTGIVLVNIENLDRAGIARLIERIAREDPAVIGVDVLFSSSYSDHLGDSLLQSVVASYHDKLVMATEVDAHSGEALKDFLRFDRACYGQVNLLTDSDGLSTIRSFKDVFGTKKLDPIHSFAFEIAKTKDSDQVDQHIGRMREEELINFIGNSDKFRVLSTHDLFAREDLGLKGKVVIAGFIGINSRSIVDQGEVQSGDTSILETEYHDLTDLFYTPMNSRYSGRSLPDMYGVVIHANIVSMILNGRFIDRMPDWLSKVLTFLFVYMHVVPFAFYFVKRHLWYHVFAKLFQLLSLIFIVLGSFMLLKYGGIYFDTKYFLLGVFLAVDVLYLYEIFAVLAYKKFGLKSYFIHEH